jgi:D-xylose transport system substrate-binding protein
MGSRTSQTALAAVICLVVAIAGCTGSTGGDGHATHNGSKVGVILPDIETSARWEELDEPLLGQALNTEGLDPDIQNADGDATKFAAIADSMINEGVKVLVIAPPNNQVGTAVASKAKARHIPTIDYDRLDTGGGASDYSVSFNNIKAGELQGRGLIRGVRGKTGANIVEIDNPLTDRNALLFEQGQLNILQPHYNAGKYRLAASQRIGDDQPPGAVFDQLLNDNAGQVDGVLTANDDVAGAVIAVLRKKGLNGKVPVIGQGATPEALKAILRGDQFMTVFNPVDQLATATAKLAGALARNDQAATDTMASTISPDLTGNRQVRSVLVSPLFITLDTVKQVTDSGVVDSREICEGELELRCNQLSIS